MLIIKIFVQGWFILIGAILINATAEALGQATWYDFLKTSAQSGLPQAFKNTSGAQWIYLLIVYPLLLGALGCAARRTIPVPAYRCGRP